VPSTSPRIFLLSPAHCGGERAKLILNEQAKFDLARRVRTGDATIGDTFSFLSGLYFRGKLAYARRFGDARVITTNRGLLPPETRVDLNALRAMGTVSIDCEDERYRAPLARDAARLRDSVGPDAQIVLLGSVATGKYVDILLDVFDDRLLFPKEFVGRGDMSRGGLMLRCVDSGKELSYICVRGAIRHGKRPPKLKARRLPKPTAGRPLA
jgi:hypothetical protein